MSINWFASELLRWHETDNQRVMPWKGEKDPYKIWLSEIILQQTRVEQGTQYYKKFIREYPTVIDLAAAELDEVLSMWEGLGYYSRARNLHFTAKTIRDRHDGVFPDTYEGLLQLKGVGPYTASAIASFAYGLPHPVLDGNSLRLVSRYTGSTRPIDVPSGKKWVQDFLEKSIPPTKAADFNQALMDFGATICKPGAPLCSQCPLSEKCSAQKSQMVDTIPVKAKKIKRSSRTFHYLYSHYNDQMYISKRTAKDIWQGLYELPMIETTHKKPLSMQEVKQSFHLPKGTVVSYMSKQTQKLTHQDITAHFYECPAPEKKLFKDHNGQWVEFKNLSTFGFPKIVRCFLDEKQLTLRL